ncbi:MAG: hypothetical protein GWN84_11035 [Gammaproteobacteria bacterium]|nr:hypothetical protein [Gammaproteobacteria bacterium]NIR83398.1 hypothetical protein [Gammaproteobacteria bacterium]NIR91320.1 hypothetical protein [Gammaproteobacteria bacterium]NIU04560.1 hypothetical protein [Gammaproteobacteria bacterium]NIV51602.1 hypothetical protein [Gammaproteobacteria bacterium]
MATGQVESWAGNISDIGPLYPFVGSEVFWFILGLALWILWHILQIAQEKKTHREELRRFGDSQTLKKLVSGERAEDEI